MFMNHGYNLLLLDMTWLWNKAFIQTNGKNIKGEKVGHNNYQLGVVHIEWEWEVSLIIFIAVTNCWIYISIFSVLRIFLDAALLVVLGVRGSWGPVVGLEKASHSCPGGRAVLIRRVFSPQVMKDHGS